MPIFPRLQWELYVLRKILVKNGFAKSDHVPGT